MQLNELNIIFAVVGGIVLLLGLVSDYFRRNWWTSDPLAALLLGILLGPLGLSWLNPDSWGFTQEHLLEQTARLTMAIGLMGIALRLSPRYFIHSWRSLTVLLGLVMPLMWVTSGLLIYLILGLPFWVSMMIGAAITPTDPIVSSSIVTGVVANRNLPARLRHLISAESGSNDGLAYPLVLLAIALVKSHSGSPDLSHWFLHDVVTAVGGAIIFGGLAGFTAGKLLMWAEQQKTIENTSFITYSLALSISVLGVAKLLGTDGVLAVFVAGVVFGGVIGGQERAREDNVQEAINRFFTLPIFIMLGLMLPWQEWMALGWRGVLLVVAILALRRLPFLLLFYRHMPALKNTQEAAFVGWFGPIGVAAIFYAGLCLRQTGVQEAWVICSLMVCASILAHSLSATPLSRRYGEFARHRYPNQDKKT